jgi:hypothetical protein
MGGWVDGWMGGWVDGWMGLLGGGVGDENLRSSAFICVHLRSGGRVDGWMGGWVDLSTGSRTGWMGGSFDRLKNRVDGRCGEALTVRSAEPR